MTRIDRGQARGHFSHGWLDTFHTFSFGDYHDPDRMQFHALRVMNEDRIAPSRGFGMHPHRDMEIVTVVLSGELEHADNLGNRERLRPDEVQVMTAGRGILHSEYNPSPETEVHLYQIWLLAASRGLTPGYAQRHFPAGERLDRWQRIAAPPGIDPAALTIHQDAVIERATLTAGKPLSRRFDPARAGWLQVLQGTLEWDGQRLYAGDAIRIEAERELLLTSAEQCELLLFDLAAMR